MKTMEERTALSNLTYAKKMDLLTDEDKEIVREYHRGRYLKYKERYLQEYKNMKLNQPERYVKKLQYSRNYYANKTKPEREVMRRIDKGEKCFGLKKKTGKFLVSFN